MRSSDMATWLGLNGWMRTSVCIVAPGDVMPGHMMLAPARTNLIAPLSTLSFGIISGYWWSTRSVGNHGPSRCWKKTGTLLMIANWRWFGL
jgi:hypothetical protein